MYGKLEAGLRAMDTPLRCTARSVQGIQKKRVASAPLRKRVRNSLKIKEIDRETGSRE